MLDLDAMGGLGPYVGFWPRAIVGGVVSVTGLAFSAIPSPGLIDPSAVSTWIGSIAVSVASAIGVMTTAWVIAKKKIDEVNKATLSGQLSEMTENQEKMRKTLHDVNNQLAAERARHEQEVERLIRQLDTLQESLDHLGQENRTLRDEVESLRGEVARLRRTVAPGSPPTDPDLPTLGG